MTRFTYLLSEMIYGLRNHKLWLYVLFFSFFSLLTFNYLNGYVKESNNIDWLDVFAEGISAFMVLIWLLVILSTRTVGRITNYFALGFIFILLSLSQDFIDEFIKLDTYTFFGDIFECMLIGLSLVTYAFWQWRKELLTISSYITQRQKLSPHTPVQTEHYKLPNIQQVLQALTTPKDKLNNNRYSFLLAITLSNENQIVHEIPTKEISRLKLSISELLFLAARTTDLVCHYAGHRYIILMENSNKQEAARFTKHLIHLLDAFVFYLESGESIKLDWQHSLKESHTRFHSKQSANAFVQESFKTFKHLKKA
ncbi:hypothetical protein [Vibrio gangliei]|uniref:hypothetical protein n=1 Tax=Vibrio gangliei TaxID=2077090 RepID=UPI000D01DB3C|nr:hypothetical protein [Vibrio gangliei]